MKIHSVTYIENVTAKQFFFSTQHGQSGLSDKWVPITCYKDSYATIRDEQAKYGNVEIEIPDPECDDPESYEGFGG